jgi:hypothetical protein
MIRLADNPEDTKFQIDILNQATGVSRSKIRQILEIASEMEANNRIDAHYWLQRNRGRHRVEMLDGGCTIYRPAAWRRS